MSRRLVHPACPRIVDGTEAFAHGERDGAARCAPALARVLPTVTIRFGTTVASRSGMAARAIATASLSFGLVTIPVKLYSTKRRESQVGFHWIHEACGSRVKMQWYCPKDDEVVERKDLVRAYESAKGEYVPVE